jgi:hypothetical protein
MTLDPSFSYSTHRPKSDGFVSRRTNVTIRGASFAVLLACVGAARFLRAQRVGGDLVNCYIPKAERVRLDRTVRLPLLAPVDLDAGEALLVQWLRLSDKSAFEQARWTGLLYQTIQTQGMQQSIPRDRGCLDLTWLLSLSSHVRESLLFSWQVLLSTPPERRVCETDTLTDALRTNSQRSWTAHLLEMARCIHHERKTIRSYTLEEVKEVTTFMPASTPSLLKKTLEQKTGTLRFGQALRLLGETNASALRDLVEHMEAVTTLEQLLDVLALTAQQCQVATAKTKFIIVPSEDDLGPLLSDVEQSSPQTIAKFLVLLSALRYPRLDEAEQDARHLSRVISLLITVLSMLLPEIGEGQNASIEDASGGLFQASSQTIVTPVNKERKEEQHHA